MGMRISKDQVRKSRVRYKLRKVSNGLPRLSVHRSGKHIYAQVIDDAKQVTLAAFSTCNSVVRKELKATANRSAAATVGKNVATLALKAGVSSVVFDRGAYLYHGRIKALAEAAREAGLKF